ncbi:MAG: GyrI-like domain-containing protein [Erysipelotrichaceae bacterium]|nr:GyrI-like domain-containing protein [Erysipelotrichaceae bacterium]
MKYSMMGFAEKAIMPDYPVDMIGFDRISNRSQGMLDPLMIQIAVFKMAGFQVLVTIDSLGFTIEKSRHLRLILAGYLKISIDQVMICFSHTHSAPNAYTETAYYQMLCDQAELTLQEACRNLQIVKAGWGLTEAVIGKNRRQTGKTDNRLGILKITDQQNQLKLLVMRVSAHANVLTSDNYRLSADYFGRTRQHLTALLHCPIMMIQGSAGDIRPLYQQDNAVYLEINAHLISQQDPDPKRIQQDFRQSQAALDKMADTICEAAVPIVETIRTDDNINIAMYSEELVFNADVPTEAQAKQIAEEARNQAGIDPTAWLKEVASLHQQQLKTQSQSVEIQYFYLNNGCLCGTANETMADTALEIMAASGNPLVFFNGYTNGCTSYLANETEYDAGGYEVLWSNLLYFPYHRKVMPFNRDTVSRLISQTLMTLETLPYLTKIKQKTVPEMTVLADHHAVSLFHDELISQFTENMQTELIRLKCKAIDFYTVFFVDAYRQTDYELELWSIITEQPLEKRRLIFKIIPASKVLYLFTEERPEQLRPLYNALFNYAKQQHWRLNGSPREHYRPSKRSATGYQTEIQLPIKI